MKLILLMASLASSFAFAGNPIYFLYSEQSDDLSQETAQVLVKANLPTVAFEDLNCSLQVTSATNGGQSENLASYTIGAGVLNDYYSLSVSQENIGNENAATVAMMTKTIEDAMLVFNLSDGYTGDFIYVGGYDNIQQLMEISDMPMPDQVMDVTESSSQSSFFTDGGVIKVISVKCGYLQ